MIINWMSSSILVSYFYLTMLLEIATLKACTVGKLGNKCHLNNAIINKKTCLSGNILLMMITFNYVPGAVGQSRSKSKNESIAGKGKRSTPLGNK
jgi:hypothetical protein